MQFKKNIGSVDQIIRSLLTANLLIPCLLGLVPYLVFYLLISLSIMLAINCLTSYCMVYDFLKISTRQPIRA